jgi:hypothetical protein
MAKFKPVSIKELLRVGQVDDEELATVLSSVLPRGAQLTSNQVEYRTSDDEWVLSLRYADGAIVDAETGPAFSAELEAKLRAALADAFDETPTRKVWRAPMFSLRRVEGWYRCRDDFLIRPAPPQAPRPSEEYAQHPWILEFSFVDSSQFQLRNLRIQRRGYELALVLHLVLRGQIDRAGNNARKHWVYMPNADGSPGISYAAWVQEGYLIPDFSPYADEFSDVSSDAPLEETPTDDYYGRRGSYAFQPLALPAAMTDLASASEGLSDAQRNRFLRSCYWLHMADVAWRYSQSLHLVSLVNAIECLAQTGEKRLETESSTKMFLDFMQKYAPGRPSRSRINKLYDARSLVTHGERLLGYDVPRATGLVPDATADRASADETRLLGRGAIINWLWREAGDSGNLLDADPYPPSKPAKPGTKSQTRIITPGAT